MSIERYMLGWYKNHWDELVKEVSDLRADNYRLRRELHKKEDTEEVQARLDAITIAEICVCYPPTESSVDNGYGMMIMKEVTDEIRHKNKPIDWDGPEHVIPVVDMGNPKGKKPEDFENIVDE